jgi:large subunit ribosomal protein L21
MILKLASTLIGPQRRYNPTILSNVYSIGILSNTEKLHCFSTQVQPSSSSSQQTMPPLFAVIHHAKVYKEQMMGRHGQQLSLTEIDAKGKDDAKYDPFAEYEIKPLKDESMFMAEYRDKEEENDNDSDSDDSNDEDDDDDSDDEDNDDNLNQILKTYNRDGSLRYPKSQLVKFQAGAPAGGIFCIVDMAGTQHKVTMNDVIVSNPIRPMTNYPIGSIHTFTNQILLVGTTSSTYVGMPTVIGAEIDLQVEEITMDAKVIIFKKRRRKHSQRRNGYRRDVVLWRVLDIRIPKATTETTTTTSESSVDMDFMPRIMPSKSITSN